jgi:hypothetical protein
MSNSLYSLKIILLMWQFGMVDTFTALNFIYNSGAQYASIVVGAMAEGNFTNFPSLLFEPISGLVVSYKFVKAAQTVGERQARIATLAALMASSAAMAAGSTPAANAGLGGAVAGQITHMRHVLQIRGGNISNIKDFKLVFNSLKSPILDIHPYRFQFNENCNTIFNNILQEHTARRYLNFKSSFNLNTPSYLIPIPIISSSNAGVLIGWSLGVGLISFTILGLLYLFQKAERKRWAQKRSENQKHQNDHVVIDVIASSL